MRLVNFYHLLGKEFVRRQLLVNATSSAMKNFLAKPFPNKRESIYDLELVSLDIETTGIEPEKDKIVSIGLVDIKCLGIKLDSCWHQIIQTKKNIPEQSIVIHQITDDQIKTGMSIEQAMPLLLERLSGKVMLVHNAKIELGFINKICQALYASDFVISVIDTQALAKRSLDRHHSPYSNKELRLFNLRRSRNMPAYKAHNALMDAIATAELFLAMLNDIVPHCDTDKHKARLADFLS
ncbi:DNA polymerase III epsilon subunit [hydrothermal vent metagenome]|uniref:DNA polymerase III epsilon subunit n=1 Tax=hydrothermal vent metagenome TaxID=652676 RepID=A0A3B0ZSI5_9ZZZZ